MNIKIFSYVFWPEKFLINSLAQFLSQRHDVETITGLPNYPEGNIKKGYSIIRGPYEESFNGIQIKRFPIIPRKKGFFFLILNYLTNLIFSCLRVFTVKKGDCVLVFATSPIFTAIAAVLYSKLRRVPLIIWLQDLWPESFNAITGINNKALNYFLEIIVRFIYKNTDVMMIQSEEFRKNLLKYNFKGKVFWVPNWANEEKSSQKVEWLDSINFKPYTITFAGNIGKAQSLETLIDTASLLKDRNDILFLIVGDGSELENLKNKAKGFDNIIFTGRKPSEDMENLFKKSYALLAMLKKDPAFSLTIPSKIQSYMRGGKPILSSMDGAGSQLVENYELGFSSPAENALELKNNILKMVNMKIDTYQKICGNNSYLYNQKFKASEVQSQIERILQDAIIS